MKNSQDEREVYRSNGVELCDRETKSHIDCEVSVKCRLKLHDQVEKSPFERAVCRYSFYRLEIHDVAKQLINLERVSIPPCRSENIQIEQAIKAQL